MKANNSLTQTRVIPAKAGIQQEPKPREADKHTVLSRFCGGFLINWIPAFAGMTVAANVSVTNYVRSISASKHLSLPFKERVGVRMGLNFMSLRRNDGLMDYLE